jgi:hypothetical protein
VGAEFFRADEKTDRQTDRHDEANGFFCNFANVLNKYLSVLTVEFFLAFLFFVPKLVNLKVVTRRLLHSALASTKCWSVMF